ncbi:MAG: FHA domain-containing protein [Planctomycetia bacterium]|nr:FHA domain-containing protein [Planctomycetia bacterium]
MGAELVIMQGRHAGKRVKLPPTPFVIGRGANCHLRPASASVSRLHCALAPSGPYLVLRDLKSRNGTYLNDRRVSRPTRLRDGDRIRVGELMFQVQIPRAEMTAQPQLDSPSESEVAWLLRTPSDEEQASLARREGTVEVSGDTIVLGRGDVPMVAGKYLVDRVQKKRQ